MNRRNALCAAVLALATGAALGQEHGYRHPSGHAPGWHGNIARFHEHDMHVWRGGHWAQGRRGGRLGWWWVVGPSWYAYNSPIYPYPDAWQPDGVVAPLDTQLAPPGQYWYYCQSSGDYYPYVASCPEGWDPEPAKPPNAPATAESPGLLQ